MSFLTSLLWLTAMRRRGAWRDGQEGQSELYALTFDASGKPLGGAQRQTTTPAETSIP